MIVGVSLDLKILNPRFIDWCLNWESDVSNYYLSFAYYRHSPWSFPVITRIENLYYPVGANVALMDGLPLVSVPLKLVQSLLPERIQFFGPWLLVSHWLVALIGLRLLRAMGTSPLLAWCGAALLSGATPLVYRHGHTQLTAHWLILAGILAVVRERPSKTLVALPSLGLWIHPYFLPMGFAFSALGFASLRKWPGIWWRALVMVALTILSLWVLGYFGVSGADTGYGYYIAELSTFFNPAEHPSLLPSKPVSPGAYEGYSYLGCAGLLLVLTFFATLGMRRLRSRTAPRWGLLLLCVAFAALAVSPAPHLFGEKLFEAAWLMDVVRPLGTRFRSAGRFIWPLHYYLLILGVKALHELTRGREWVQWVAAPALVLLHAADVGPAYLEIGRDPRLTAETGFSVPEEVRSQLSARSRFLFFSPPVRVICRKRRWRRAYYNYALFGAENGLITNADFGLARTVPEEASAVCNETLRVVRERARRADVIVVKQ